MAQRRGFHSFADWNPAEIEDFPQLDHHNNFNMISEPHDRRYNVGRVQINRHPSVTGTEEQVFSRKFWG